MSTNTEEKKSVRVFDPTCKEWLSILRSAIKKIIERPDKIDDKMYQQYKWEKLAHYAYMLINETKMSGNIEDIVFVIKHFYHCADITQEDAIGSAAVFVFRMMEATKAMESNNENSQKENEEGQEGEKGRQGDGGKLLITP